MTKTAETNGILSVDELGDCLEAFGFNADDEDIDFLKKHLDENADGDLEVEELVKNIDVLNWHCFHGKDLMKEFTKIDSDKDGVIRYPEMLRVLTTRGPEPLSPMEGRRLLDMLARRFDANFDGKFSYAEFVKIYMSDALPYKNSLGGPRSDDEGEAEAAAAADKKKKKPAPIKKKSSTLSSQSNGSKSSLTVPSARSGPSSAKSTGSASSGKSTSSGTSAATRRKSTTATTSGATSKSPSTAPTTSKAKPKLTQRRSTTTN